MSKRLIWLWLAAVLPLAVLVWPLYTAVTHAPYDLIINEWSQGDGGSREWVELLVVSGPADLRGWDLGDSSPGDLTFAADPLWSSVPAGSLIVIYNGSDPDPILPPDDADLSDCRLVLSHQSAHFSGGWPAFANSNSLDNPHLRDAAGATVHDFTAAPGGSRHPSASQNVRYDGNMVVGVSDPAQWTVGDATADATPGGGNGGANSAWIAGFPCGGTAVEPDLGLRKDGPATAVAGAPIQYTLTFSNGGALAATGVQLTDTLPAGFTYLADDSGYPLSQPAPGLLVWSVGTVPTGTTTSFHLTAQIPAGAGGTAVNQALIATPLTETHTANNNASATTVVAGPPPAVLIDALYYDTYEINQPDEAIQLRNVGAGTAAIGGWAVSDGGSTAVLPAGATLPPGGAVWLARESAAFQRQFGFPADYEVTDSDPAVPQMSGTWPGFSDDGDEALVLDDMGAFVDALVYESGNTGQAGWSGTAVQPYTPSSTFAAEGQILYRRRDPATGAPVPDTNTAADWAQMTGDVINGRKVRYPGWDLAPFFHTARFTETADVTIAIAPDNAYEAIAAEIDAATTSIDIETLTFENVPLAEALIAAVNRGVAVTVLLEGGPAGGLTDQERYICQQLEAAGGQCWFMINEPGEQIHDRYKFLHAKFIIVDGARAVISSENLSPRSLATDDKSDGTWGRRGVALITGAPSVVAHLQALFALDLDPASHVDVLRWTPNHPLYGDAYGRPPAGFIPDLTSGGMTYTVRYPAPDTFAGTFAFEIIQSPENSLHPNSGLLALAAGAGAGDTILVQQLNERPYWGPSDSNPGDDPNPRLEAYLDAARRGARVRLLLDAFFDDGDAPTSNQATCDYVQTVARTEGLAVDCALGNPTGLGIHNKMVLVEIDGRGIVHIGSLNGTEQSHKGNRELALQFHSDAAYALLADLFDRDWPHRALLPVVLSNYQGPAAYPLISEVLYDPSGPDGAEFIELVNPTGSMFDLTGHSLGDAVQPTDFEDVRRFPDGTLLPPGETLVVAFSAADFRAKFGFNPDFEIDETDAAVPNLIDDPSWGDPAAVLQLGNAGDEVILRDGAGQPIDVLAYGTGSFPGVVTYNPLPPPNANRSLERFPFWRDTNDCIFDFRERALPNPGSLP